MRHYAARAASQLMHDFVVDPKRVLAVLLAPRRVKAFRDYSHCHGVFPGVACIQSA